MKESSKESQAGFYNGNNYWEHPNVYVPRVTENMTKSPETLRTDRQNRSLHLYLNLLATALNAAGLPLQKVLKPTVGVDWNERLTKELLWRPIQRAVTGKESTTKLRKADEVALVYETLNRHLGERFGLHVDWPHFEKPSDYDQFTAS